MSLTRLNADSVQRAVRAQREVIWIGCFGESWLRGPATTFVELESIRNIIGLLILRALAHRSSVSVRREAERKLAARDPDPAAQDTTWFWLVVDQYGPFGLPSDEKACLQALIDHWRERLNGGDQSLLTGSVFIGGAIVHSGLAQHHIGLDRGAGDISPNADVDDSVTWRHRT